jgi:hypothetical protein
MRTLLLALLLWLIIGLSDCRLLMRLKSIEREFISSRFCPLGSIMISLMESSSACFKTSKYSLGVVLSEPIGFWFSTKYLLESY